MVNEEGIETSKDELHFFYDDQARPAFIEYEGTMYRYIHNLQGDIVAIVDAAGNPVVEYKYDAWGKRITCNSETDNRLYAINPFRYREYVFDEETQLYYLRNRYYNPEYCRFCNTDVLMGVGVQIGIHNIFIYCNNNPVNHIDPSGNLHTQHASAGWGGSIYGWGLSGSSGIGGGGSGSLGVSGGNSAAASTVFAIIGGYTAGEITSALIEQYEQTAPKDYTVYLLADNEGQIQYVGRVKTKNYGARMSYHRKTRGLTPAVRIDGLNYAQCRGLEQYYMIKHNTLNPDNYKNNQIRGISPKNPAKAFYVSILKRYLGNFIENEVLNALWD